MTRGRATHFDKSVHVSGFSLGVDIEHSGSGDAKVGDDGRIFTSCLVFKEVGVSTAMVARLNPPVVSNNLGPLFWSTTFDFFRGKEKNGF